MVIFYRPMAPVCFALAQHGSRCACLLSQLPTRQQTLQPAAATKQQTGGKATRLRMQVQNYRALALWTVIDDSNYFDAVNTNVKVFYFRSHD